MQCQQFVGHLDSEAGTEGGSYWSIDAGVSSLQHMVLIRIHGVR